MSASFESYARAQLDRLDWCMNDWAHHLPAPGEQVSDFRLIDIIEMGTEIDDLVVTVLQGIISTGALLGSGMQERFREVAGKQIRLNELLALLAARVENWADTASPPTVH